MLTLGHQFSVFLSTQSDSAQPILKFSITLAAVNIKKEGLYKLCTQWKWIHECLTHSSDLICKRYLEEVCRVKPRLRLKHGICFLFQSQAVFSLYSAGVWVAENCRSCPSTYRTLLSLRTFINSNSLGSAGFWLLGPGAILGSSYGPTNTRLRCHLGM